jgi:hypothetical protein
MQDSNYWDDSLGEEDGERDIQSLLDEAYDLLDGFVVWLEEELDEDVRLAQMDCTNCEFLLDYLANYEYKSIREMNEFDLRWFVFSHYIRKATAGYETEEMLLDSLRRFFNYLRKEHLYTVPEWIPAVLEDRVFYLKRLADFKKMEEEDEEEWQAAFREWCRDLEEDLSERLLWLPREMGEGLFWLDAMGWREAALYQEANHHWQTQRVHLLSQGLEHAEVLARLQTAYAEWLQAGQERLSGMSPLQIIQAERRERSLREVEEDDGEE